MPHKEHSGGEVLTAKGAAEQASADLVQSQISVCSGVEGHPDVLRPDSSRCRHKMLPATACLPGSGGRQGNGRSGEFGAPKSKNVSTVN